MLVRLAGGLGCARSWDTHMQLPGTNSPMQEQGAALLLGGEGIEGPAHRWGPGLQIGRAHV